MGPIAREARMAREARAAEPRAVRAGDEIRNERIGKLYNTGRHSSFLFQVRWCEAFQVFPIEFQ